MEASVSTATFGVVALPTTWTFFHVVFGPEDGQATVYNDVIHLMFQEVLMVQLHPVRIWTNRHWQDASSHY